MTDDTSTPPPAPDIIVLLMGLKMTDEHVLCCPSGYSPDDIIDDAIVAIRDLRRENEQLANEINRLADELITTLRKSCDNINVLIAENKTLRQGRAELRESLKNMVAIVDRITGMKGKAGKHA